MNTQEWSLTHQFFPKKKISEVPVLEIQAALITIFKSIGVPQWIKVDNGRPFGDPQLKLVPPIALWLIGLGIKVIWNRPATPQDNAVVERSQGVMGKWTEYQKCKHTFDLQMRLWKEVDFHNYHFPIRRRGNKTRIQLFPKLMHTGRDWQPKNFKLNRILIFMAKGCWERKASSSGQVNFYGHRFSIGSRYRHQIISIKLNPRKNCWNIFEAKGSLVKSQPSAFTEQNIWKLDLS